MKRAVTEWGSGGAVAVAVAVAVVGAVAGRVGGQERVGCFVYYCYFVSVCREYWE